MNTGLYLDQFNNAAAKLNKELLIKKQIETQTGTWLKSVVLRMQKRHWANHPDEKPQTGSAIFFSIWMKEQSEKENNIFYNIHALKLRQLKGYSIESRKFANAFRGKFKKFEKNWPDVNVNFGPQTLMQGFKKIDLQYFENDILALANKFLAIDFLIDDLLDKYKLPAKI